MKRKTFGREKVNVGTPSRTSAANERDAMSVEEPTEDPHKASGAAVREPTVHPQAGGKAEPAGTAGERKTGEERAAQNRAEDPPA
jgi:hypothetical protein